MNIKFTDEAESYTRCEYIKETNIFQLKSMSEDNIIEYRPTLMLDDEYNPEEYYIYFLHNQRRDCTENSIYKVNVGKERIGWIFPLQALLSKEHDYAENKFFLKYAYVTIYNLLNNITSFEQTNFVACINLEDYYDETLNLLVLDKYNCSKVDDFNLDDYIVSLFQKGYSFGGKGNLYTEVEKPEKVIKLKPISSELKDAMYINELFKELIPEENEAFVKFFVYYQIIEILIAKVFENDFHKFIDDLRFDTDVLFDKRDELNNMVGEKGRVKKLLNSYVTVSADKTNELNNLCVKLLELHKRQVGKNYAENLYSVRCLLVHKLYMLDKSANIILVQLNSAFLDVLMEVLLTFKKPSQTL